MRISTKKLIASAAALVRMGLSGVVFSGAAAFLLLWAVFVVGFVAGWSARKAEERYDD